MSLRIVLTHVYAWPEVRRGGERYLHEIASGLKAAGHDVAIVSTAPSPSRATIEGVEVRYLRRRHAMRGRFKEQTDEVNFAVDALARMAFRHYDVWHALGTADAAAAAMAGRVRRGRSVFTDLGISARSWRRYRPDERLYGYVIKRVDDYICLSDAARRSVLADYGRDAHVLGGGVDLASFAPGRERSEKPSLLFTSDVAEPRKNFPLLLDAIGVLAGRGVDVELWVAGPGDPAPALAAAPASARAAVRPLGVGALADLPSLYSRAWATVLPSYGEAFGIVVVESLACGTPVVTLDDAGPAELVAPGTGATAAATPDALATAIERALQLARDPGTRERCRAAAEPHDWRTGVVPRLERIYCGG
jgi:phosphatidyl-myo-inositol alpha-mannosyltransferase